ncbi:helix-turn-helix transcriptional regulator [Halomarina pelagica]|uniref:helix-turn-helix transcriptional regulator n=1 Tax=Halomarina pelagica TaxID=2961599 RepID=UPI0020C1CB67|nr:helix-turn-helix domain-containing protein [Halomarina sp. BND7]
MAETDWLVGVVRRGPFLAALRERPHDRRDLQAALDVSKPTVHRAMRALDDEGLVERSDGRYRLTGAGRIVAERVASLDRAGRAIRRLSPLLALVDPIALDLDVERFADATVTTAGAGAPYRPVRRFMTLVEGTDSLRGFDTTTVAPMHVEGIYERIVDGMETDVVYPSSVVEEILESNPERGAAAVESGNLALSVHEEVPCGLALFDDRVGIGGYDPDTGALRVFVDTDDPDAYAWGESLYERYRTEATPLVGPALAAERNP